MKLSLKICETKKIFYAVMVECCKLQMTRTDPKTTITQVCYFQLEFHIKFSFLPSLWGSYFLSVLNMHANIFIEFSKWYVKKASEDKRNVIVTFHTIHTSTKNNMTRGCQVKFLVARRGEIIFLLLSLKIL